MRASKLLCLSVAAVISASPAVAASIAQQWQGAGFTDSGLIWPDIAGAVSGNYIVEMVNNAMRIYEKKTGAVLTPATGGSLMAASGYNPRVVFDPLSRRWYAVSRSTVYSGFTTNEIYYSKSGSADPTKPWRSSWWMSSGVNTPQPVQAAFTSLSVSGGAATIGVINDDGFGAQVSTSLYSIRTQDTPVYPLNPKCAFHGCIDQVASNLTSFDTLPFGTAGYLPQGISTGTAGTTTTLLAFDNTNPAGDSLIAETIANTNSARGAVLSGPTGIVTAYGGTPNPGRQPAGPTYLYNTGTSAITAGVFEVAGLAYFARTIANGTDDAIAWGIFDVASGALVAQGLIATAGMDYSYPSVAADAAGTFVIGFNGSGPSAGQNLSAYAAVCTHTASATSCNPPMLIAAGSSPGYKLQSNLCGFGPAICVAWGQYSVTVQDPAIPGSFWLFQEVPVPDPVWGTAWGTVITRLATP